MIAPVDLPSPAADHYLDDDHLNDRRIRVFVYTRDPVSQAGISSQLRGGAGVTVVDWGEIDTAHVAIVAADRIDAEVAQVVRAMQRNDCPRVVVVASTLDRAGVRAAVEAGACAFLRRGEAVTERLVATIRAAAAPDLPIAPDPAVITGGEMAGPLLSARELAVLRMVAEGYGNAEIAEEMAYSERTIKNIMHRVVSHLGARNRCHAVAYAVREGLV